MPKDFTAELVGCKLFEQPLDIYNVACGKPQEVDTTPPHPTRFEALFGLYRDYKEYDYEDWQIAKPSSCSEDVSEEVEAALLYYAQKSLERRQNSTGTTLWERMKRTATNLAQRIVDWAPLSATLSSQIAQTAEHGSAICTAAGAHCDTGRTMASYGAGNNYSACVIADPP